MKKKINFNSMRKGKIIGEHEVLFSSGKRNSYSKSRFFR